MSVDVIVCETCRSPEPQDGEGWTGALFAALLEGVVAASPELAEVRVTTMRCLMSCRRPCAVHIRSPDRMGYVLGDLPPERTAVQALADYLASYRRSSDGVVPYKDWPEGVRGRFVARVPPLPSS
jgi:predicted metal-binding protein